MVYGALGLFVFIALGLRLRYQISRPFLATFIIMSWLLLAGFRIAARSLIPALSREFGLKRYVLIVGADSRALQLARTLEDHYEDGIRIVGFLAPPDEASVPATVKLAREYRVFPLDSLRTMLSQNVIDELHFAVESGRLPSLEEVFLWCDVEGVCSRVAVDFFPHVNSTNLALERVGDTPLLTFTAVPDDDILLLAKRSIDITLALVGIILLSPLFVAAAILVRFTSPGPVIFRQTRCGLNGRTFTLYKFRSMVEDAERRVPEVEHLSQKEIAMKIPNDPRLTAVGRWLRKFSIDEIPQLVNVLKGDMSLVGPRPAIPSEVQYQHWQRRRLRMRPGLTCLWAVQGRDSVNARFRTGQKGWADLRPQQSELNVGIDSQKIETCRIPVGTILLIKS